VQITLESHDKVLHDQIVGHSGAWEQTNAGIQNAVRSKLFVMTNTTLLKTNSVELEKTLQYLSDLKVPTIGLNGLIYSGRGASVMSGIQEQDLPELLSLATFFTQTHGQRLIWYTPTQYCHFDPVSSGLGVKGCTAALYNMCIEPDGSVLPCQSYYHSLGNFLTDSWENIWDYPLAQSIRAKHYLKDKCHNCNILSECGGGCPLFIDTKTEIQSRIIEKA
jgi:radical SAM protein with 4Fe4S-binding SPASM domain